jgi:tetratricopeptide (TPR) repeat protein
MTFNLRTSHLLLTVSIFFVCMLAVTTDAAGQPKPKETGEAPGTKAATARRERRKDRPKIPPASKTPAAIESDNFLGLGDRFSETEKWNAAEAAYKEAVKVLPSNDDALLELGYVYLTNGKMDEAQQIHSRLRSLNTTYASELLAEINRRKSTKDH